MGEPRERPILMSGGMVRALLEGRKTQTRRVVAGQRALAPGVTQFPLGGLAGWVANDSAVREEATRLLPRIERGDLLWVRESLRQSEDYARWEYAADGLALRSQPAAWGERCAWTERVSNRSHVPSIHMPRWAARITLSVTSVRVERLQDISEGDVAAEGLILMSDGYSFSPFEHGRVGAGPASAFAYLWDSINGRRIGCAWSDNPWVWVVGFERRT